MTLQDIEKINMRLQLAMKDTNQIESESEEQDEIKEHVDEREFIIIRGALNTNTCSKGGQMKGKYFSNSSHHYQEGM